MLRLRLGNRVGMSSKQGTIPQKRVGVSYCEALAADECRLRICCLKGALGTDELKKKQPGVYRTKNDAVKA